MNPLQDVFISYGRADSKQFAKTLYDRLTALGLTVWFDFEDIPLGVDYQKQIDDGIDKADNFLFLIAPHSVNSPYCGLEVELALKRNKRIIPLLHVEEISRETWQQRNPNGTDEAWETYKAAGKHSSFPNMHPAISKINWVYFREDIDDFEQSLKGLLEIFERQKDYVHQHTLLLNQALDWEKNNRHAQTLLAEADLQQAETWLQTRFSETQPPCLPTKLHCQFISESLKQAQDGLTDVFLSHAEEDRATFEIIYESITRAGLTIWTSWQDIQTGVDFEEAINLGIEAADNIVYLMSATSLQSKWCQHELNYGLSLNKRIIPVLIEPIPVETIPAHLQKLQFIDLTDNLQASDYLADERDLLRALRQDADYYNAHKLLLVKALKWERQLKNPSILLQGPTLRQTEAWLQVSQKRDRHPALPIQVEFVQESLKQPQDIGLNVFIASDIKDLGFARKLNDTLQVQGERTWFEPNRAVLGADATDQVKQGIERAENVLVVLSQAALANATVLEEVEIATALSKRIVVVSYQNFDFAELPNALSSQPRVDFSTHGVEFVSPFGELYRILKSHPQHVQTHTRLLVRALAWQDSGPEDSALLRGKELTKAQQWLSQAQTLTPKPSDLQLAYIEASQALSSRKLKPRTVLGLSVGTTLLVWVVRLLGLLQGAELAVYDHLLQRRPPEPQDDRFLVVTVDDASGAFLRKELILGNYAPSISAIPDDALRQLLTILQENQARLIGLDFYRDFPAQPSVASLIAETDSLITVCKSRTSDFSGVKKAPEVSIDRVGFSDLVADLQDGNTYVRRHYLMQGKDPDFCNTNTSLSVLLADRYLQQEGITYTDPTLANGGFLADGLQFDAQTVPSLNLGRGPYYPPFHKILETFAGYQSLLNFRASLNSQGKKDTKAFAPVVPLEALLAEAVPQELKELIQDRIVLIGYTDYADRNTDVWETPYGEMPGVFLHGQMASQLISMVLDGRSLIRWWPFWGEVLWVVGWAISGGAIVWQLKHWSRLSASLGIAAVGLYGSGYGAMVYGSLWIPLVPPLAAFALTAGGVAMLNARLRNP